MRRSMGAPIQGLRNCRSLGPAGKSSSPALTPDTTLPETPLNASYQASSAGGDDVFILQVDPTAIVPANSLVNATSLGGNLTDMPYASASTPRAGFICWSHRLR